MASPGALQRPRIRVARENRSMCVLTGKSDLTEIARPRINTTSLFIGCEPCARHWHGSNCGWRLKNINEVTEEVLVLARALVEFHTIFACESRIQDIHLAHLRYIGPIRGEFMLC